MLVADSPNLFDPGLEASPVRERDLVARRGCGNAVHAVRRPEVHPGRLLPLAPDRVEHRPLFERDVDGRDEALRDLPFEVDLEGFRLLVPGPLEVEPDERVGECPCPRPSTPACGSGRERPSAGGEQDRCAGQQDGDLLRLGDPERQRGGRPEDRPQERDLRTAER